ncbi:TonB-dependent receptor plug domain-containing protein [Opitutia bacterium ISCC 51]|nr:TonB-dependent receptor plug domain-containing protein [Opitutae bacterium ISCC 51]QXD29671.1 TonB-dependent receptor plug domain-containing protein [Opitutae bacterium ISCC 52]
MKTILHKASKALAYVLPLFCVIVMPFASAQEDDDVYNLSLFQIDEEETQGYLATSTLAGTRIKTDLKDLGAAISVVTSEFMDDISATDAQTLLSYTSNTEVGGFQGNFSGAQASNRSRFVDNDSRTNPQRNQRIRGLGAADLTRGYFLTDIAFDSYNTERVTVSRGPNSLLFGIGSPGGVINNATKQAIHNNNFGELGIRFDNYGSWRAEVDYNKVIVEDRVSLRVALLEESQEYKQEPAHEDQHRVYAALNVVLSENEASDFLDATIFRANYERGERSGSPVEVIPPSVAYHGWFEPTPSSISQYTGSVPAANARAPGDGGTWEFQALHDDPLHIGSVGSSEAAVGTNVHPSNFRHNAIYYPGKGAPANVGIPGSNIQGYTSLIPWRASQGDTIDSTGLAGSPLAAGLPGDTGVNDFREFATNSPYAESYAIGFAVPTLRNTDVFDYRNKMYTNGLDLAIRDFDVMNLALEQNFFNNNAGIEIAYDEQSYDTYQDFIFSGGLQHSSRGEYDIYVMNSTHLINGQPNPNLGRAFTANAGTQQQFEQIDRETFRVTAFAKLDLTENDGFLGMLGRHTFTGLYNDHTKDRHWWTNRDATGSDEFSMNSAMQHQLGGGRRNTNLTVFTSDSLIGVQSMDDVRLYPIDFPRPQVGDTFEYLYVDTTPASNANSNGIRDRSLKTGTIYTTSYLQDENISQNSIEAKAFAWQGYFLDDHIVGLYGWREDDTKSFARANATEVGFSQRLPDLTHNPDYARLSNTPSLEETGDTTTWSVVGRYPEVLFGELPFNLQVHYAESENFNPIGLRNSPLGVPIGQPTGTTEEYGFQISSDDNKYAIKFNWFETRLANSNTDPALTTNFANHVVGRINAYRDAQQGGFTWADELTWVEGPLESYPHQSFEEFYAASLATIPSELASVANPRPVDDDGDGEWDRYETDSIPNVQSTQDRVAEGFEVELVANFTPNWRMMMNISQQETVQSNTATILAGLAEDYVSAVQSARLGETEQDGSLGADSEAYEVSLLGGLLAPIRGAKALDNTASNEQREWRITGVTNYEFTEGRLDGFGIGGAFRWEDEAATGYVFQLEPESGVPVPDVTRPYFDDGLFSGDLWFTYGQRIWDDKIDWSIRLNIRNLVGESDDIPVKTNPDGQVAVIRIPNPRTVYLSNTFKF